MKNRLLEVIGIVLVLVVGAYLGLPAPTQAQTGNRVWILKPQLIATASQVDVCTLTGGPPCNVDVQLCYADASTNGTATTITFADRQTVPVVRPNALAITANSWWMFPLNFLPISSTQTGCAWYPGGLKITVGNANALSIQMSGRY